MKIAYASDTHIEFGDLVINNDENADVLILAGDIILAKDLFDKDEIHNIGERKFKAGKSESFHNFFKDVCDKFKNVIYIFGNHEYYHSDFATAFDHIKEKFSYLSNLHILEKESINIDHVTFICGTMWTNFNNNDHTAKYQIEHSMNDYHIVKNSNRMINDRPAKLSADDTYEDHLKFMEFATNELKKDEITNVVMVTHHCPSLVCVPEKYHGDVLMNPGYISDLSEFILDNPKIKNWICGHSHNRMDFMIGNCNLLMNCRGYHNYELMADSFELKYFDI